ncbi:hypothetical protein [Caballeronia sp. ATUFL_F1_KS39]|uniref:hypothetical protein n=1 Tax=Caballeronia sp. ATUFL_F1_KS39 TaxID=2921766 RepID=UPI002027ED4A|nr:hypothetical protein [Caballeronia sp. ATUFL_F1_KS39]
MTDKEPKREAVPFPRFSVAAGEKRTKIGRLRELFDEIETAQQQGWRLEEILRGLADQGLDVSLNTLKVSIKRLRKNRIEPISRTKKETVEPQNKSVDNVQPRTSTTAGTISKDGFRNPMPTFHRDVTKRLNLDE